MTAVLSGIQNQSWFWTQTVTSALLIIFSWVAFLEIYLTFEQNHNQTASQRPDTLLKSFILAEKQERELIPVLITVVFTLTGFHP